MTKRTLYPIVFALLLLLGGWGSKASGQSSGATYAVRYTLPKGVSDLRCVTYLPSEGKVVVTPGRKLPAGVQLTFTATVEAGYEIDHWTVNGELAQHEPEAYGGAKIMEMVMPEEDIDVVIVMKQSATRRRSSEECIVTLESSAGGHLSALYVDFDPFEQEEQDVYVESGDAVPKNITLEVNAIPDMGAKIGKWYQDDVAISGSEGSTRQTFVIRKDTKIKVDFETSAKPFEGYIVTLPNESPEGTIAAYYEDDNYNHVSLQAGENKVPKWKFVFLTAMPKAGYEFSYWTFNGQRNDDLIMKLSDNSCKYEPDADVTIGAVFKRTAPAGHKITLTAGEGGTLQCSLSTGPEVQSGSTVDDGVALRFTAKPMKGYKTDQWTINGVPFAKGKGKNTIIQKADKDLNVEVSFLKDIELYTVEYVAEAGGTIKSATYYDRTTYNYVDFESGKELPKGSEVDIEVEPKAGYVVDLWYLNDQPIDASKGKTSQTIKISGNSKIRITFATKPKQTVTYTASTGGTIQGTLLGTAFDSGAKLDEGSYIIFTATPDEGYEVDQWRIDDEVVTRYAGKKEIQERLGNKPLKVEVSFKKLPVTYEVTYSAGEGGDIVGANYDSREVIPSGSKVKENDFMRFTAKPNTAQGYKVDQWFVNGQVQNQLTGSLNITWQIKAKTDVKVTFKKEQMYEVDYKPDNEWGTIEAYYYDGGRKVTVEPKAKVKEGTIVEFQATVKEGYALDGWTNNGHEIPVADIETHKASLTLRANAVIDVKYHKVIVKHAVTFTAGEGGAIAATVGPDAKAIQSNDQVEQGAVITFTATSQEGYELDQWMVNDNPAVAGADTKIEGNKLIVTLGDQDLKVEATFKKVIVKHTVTYTAGEGGTLQCFLSNGTTEVQSGSTVDDGVALRFNARPMSGYKTDQWTINGKPFAKGKNTIIQKADKDLNVEVSFLKDIELYTVEYVAEAGGTIKSATYYDRTTYDYVDFESGKELPKGSEVDIEVEPKAGYVVDLWYLNDQPIDASKGKTSQTITISENSKIRITFATKPKQTVTYTASTGGTIQGTLLGTAFDSGAKLDEGSYIIFTATPDEGYEVDQWSIDGEVVTRYAGKKEITERLGNKPLKVEVSFKKLPVTFPVVFTAGEGGTIVATVAEGSAQKGISSGDAIVQYSRVTFTAKPKSGYLVDQWTVNDQPQQFFAGKPELTRTVREALKVHVTFKEDQPAKLCTINYTKENEWGTLVAYYDTQSSGRINVKPGDKVEEGYMITFLATPKEGYTIDHWTYNGTKTPTVKPEMLTVTAKEDMTVAVVCNKAKLCTVTFDAVSEGGKMTAYYLKDEGFSGYKEVYIKSGVQVPAGTEVTFDVTLTEGYTLEHWLVNNTKKACDKYSPLRLYELVINDDTEVKAVYKAPQKPQHAVTFTAGEGGTIAATVGAEAKAIQSNDQVEQGAVITFTATPQDGYELDQWMVNDKPAVAGADTKIEGNKLIVTLGDQDLEVEATFKKLIVTYEVTYSAGEGGDIVGGNYNGREVIPSGSKVNENVYMRFTAVPNTAQGYKVDQWFVNGQVQDKLTGRSYINWQIKAKTDVKVTFRKEQMYEVDYKPDNEWGTIEAYYYDGGRKVTVEPKAKVKEGTFVEFQATVKDGYALDAWTNNGDEIPVADIETHKASITLRANAVIDVKYHKLVVKHAVTFTAGEGGAIAATVGPEAKAIQSKDQVEQGAVITFTATPQEGYELDQWMVNDNPAVAGADTKIEGNKLIVTLGDQDLTVKATFKKVIVKHTVTYTAGEGGRIVGLSGDAKSKVDSGSKVDKGTMVRLIAIADADKGYMVDQWTINGEVKPEYTGKVFIVIPINTDTKISVSFKKQNKYKVFFTSDNEWGKLTAKYSLGGFIDVESGQELKEGTIVYFSASVKDGYEIDSWTCNGNPIKDSSPKAAKITLKTDSRIEVQYHKVIVKHAVTFTAGEGGAIAATVGTEAKAIQSKDQVEQGAVITFTATPQEGYELDQWMVNDNPAVAGADTKIEGNKLIVTLGDQDLTVKATFKKVIVKHAVTFTAGEGGAIAATVGPDAKAIQSKDQVEQGAVITFTATPKDGYELDQWMVNGNPAVAGADTKIEGNKLIVTLGDQDLMIKATFKKVIVKHAVTFTAGEGGAIAATVGPDAKAIQSKDQVEQGAVITFTATPQEGYELDQWMVNGKPAVAGADTKIEGNKLIVTLGDQDLTVKATFKKVIVKHAVTFTAGEGGAIAATVGPDAKAIQSKDQVEQGAVITFTATPQKGYELDQWMVNGKPAVAGADTKIEGNKLIVTLGDQDLMVKVTFRKVNAISQISEAELAVYPNPFAERIVITIPAERIGQTAYLTSMQGEVVLQMTLEQTETVLYTDALSQGTYLLRVGSHSQLLIKE